MRTQPKIFVSVLSIFLLFSAFAFRTVIPCTVSGTVIEKGTTDPVISAAVILNQNGKPLQTALTDANGKFCFQNVADGNYRLDVKYVGFSSFTSNILVKDGKCNALKIEMEASHQKVDEVVITTSKVTQAEEQSISYGAIAPMSLTNASLSRSVGYGKLRNKNYERYADAAPAPVYDWIDDGNVKDKKEKTEPEEFNTEDYDRIVENEFQKPTDRALSTFSIDVDVASYGILRKKLDAGQTPPKESIRLEEMINYFTYDYAEPTDGKPFSVNTELGECPWNQNHRLLHVGIQGKHMEKKNLPPSNLVFLIDVSGSMDMPDKLPLVKQSLRMLVNELSAQDKIAMVVYAGSSGLVLPSTPCSQKEKIIEALDRLEAGGSTAGAAGINLAYKTAKENLLENGNNRVILCTDGDFNVGVSSDAELTSLIEKKREEGIFLSVLGFGMGNYKDSKMEKLADKGNGNYAYIDNANEAKKNLVTQMGGTLLTIAKDVKIQVEFNPAKVKAYRLIGYENRALADKDFNDDKKDAGEIGAGVSVTALYEIVADENDASFKEIPKTDALKYQSKENKTVAAKTDEMLTVKIRYKEPKENTSKLIEYAVKDETIPLIKTSDNFRFASSVASFGMLLRDSKFKGNFTFEKVKTLAEGAKGKDKEGYRTEFVSLIQKAKTL
ncbi:MAG: von Willebrand factor type A domain-containing protein [Bacteroidetes bacterium]|nr:von Willebrand factor type A domain-containing protein [Bacteroidota bacterium]